MNFILLDYKISEKKKEFLDNDTKPLYYFEINPAENYYMPDFDILMFKNFYTYTINIVQFSNDKWKCVLSEYKIMPEADCDEDSEKYCLINKKQLVDNGLSEEATILRIYISQDSSLWKNYTIKEIKFFKENVESEFPNNNNNIENIKYSLNNSRFEFNSNNFTILNDKEEINQKFIEVMKVNYNSDLNFTILK